MPLLPILRKSPFARLLLFYGTGILTAQVFNNLYTFWIILSLGAVILLLIVAMVAGIHHESPFKNYITGVFLCILLYMAGLTGMAWQEHTAETIRNFPDKQGIYVFQILNPPEIREHTVRFSGMVRVNPDRGSNRQKQFRIMVYLERDSSALNLGPGNRIMALARITNISPPGNPDEFDYRNYLAARNIFKQTYLRSGSWVQAGNHEPIPLRCHAYAVQANLLRAFDQIGMDSSLCSILSAITLGYRSDLDARTRHVFTQAGVMHVMALSGFNVAVIAFTLGYIFGIFDYSGTGKVVKAIIIILMIWAFAFITGLSPSVTRASVMLSFVLTGKLMNRQINTYNILFASAFLLLAFSPALFTDVSFQLSFTAVLGILLYHPILYRLLSFKNILADKVWNLFTISCAAQLSTLPLTLYYFHQFPLYFWLANLYVVPAVSVIVILSGVFLLLSVLPSIALIVGKILAFLLDVLYRAIVLIEFLPCSLIEHIQISLSQAVILFLFILVLFLFFHYREKGFLMASLLFILVFQLIGLHHNQYRFKQKSVLVGNLKGRSVFGIISGREAVFWRDSILVRNNRPLHYALDNFWLKNGVAGNIRFIPDYQVDEHLILQAGDIYCCYPWQGHNVVMQCAGKRVVFLQDEQLFSNRSADRLKADLVIVSGNIKPDLDGIIRVLETDLLILDASVRKRQVETWKKACLHHGITCWDVAEQGAYYLKYRSRRSGI